MRHIKDILHLKHQNQLSIREIARSCGIPISTVGDYLQRAQATGLGWPLPEGLSESQLMERLSAPADATEAVVKPLPNWPHSASRLSWRHRSLEGVNAEWPYGLLPPIPPSRCGPGNGEG